MNRNALRTLWLEACLRVRLFYKTAVWCLGLSWLLNPSALGGCTAPVGRLKARVIRGDGKEESLGLLSTKVVTDAGVAAIVDAFQNTVELENFVQHASGTGNTAENVADTTLVTEVESRVAGTAAENGANVFQSVATIPYTATRAIVEHGLFNAATAGTLMDRSVFAAINVDNGDSIEFTYELTFPAGS